VIEKPYLDNWRHRVGREDADRVLRNAAEFGTKLHGAAQKVAWRASKRRRSLNPSGRGGRPGP
jgi:hypothetical protein